MKITKVKIKPVPDKKRLKAMASITLDNELIINDIKIIQTTDRLCAEFPKPDISQNNHREYIVPLNCKVRKLLESSILCAYENHIKV
jgi:stage V sporulation protein G